MNKENIKINEYSIKAGLAGMGKTSPVINLSELENKNKKKKKKE